MRERSVAARRMRNNGAVSSKVRLLTGAALVIGAVAIVIAERRRPLRTPTQPELDRAVSNVLMGACCGLAILAAETPLVQPIARRVGEHRSGLVQKLPGPEWLRDIVGVLLMDYTFYVWHRLTHKVPWLWRFHLVHHIDMDMDTSTAIRFHALDMIISAPWKAGQVALIGMTSRGLKIWQTFFFLSILFHHSNIRLPERLERWLAFVLTTPRMHGIHHSAVEDETNSNWSSGFSFWDHLHRTFRLDIPQSAIAVGVPAFRDPHETTILPSLQLPFQPQRDDWDGVRTREKVKADE